MLDRIQELLQVRELSSSQFADAIGVSRPVVSHLLSGRNKPSLEVVQKIIAAFPDLSLSWLLNGAGPMLERQVAADATKATVNPGPAALSPGQPAPRVQPATEPAPAVAPAPAMAPEAAPQPTAAATEPVETPKTPTQPRAVAPAPSATPAATSSATRAGANLAYALAEPGKSIRRIVLFYQDGTFTDFRPEAEG
ncbi:helix-turn-helix domain-containing protein [Hymenobacter psychrophilus]|uniref:DNA-binding transcriptional regulator, XRE-family HTH domain n=1 Tax=Hymenobacter psychrophilus TaxID=651662 RepID=A0A1H3BUE5_9BACT|nr:helix-turn-helix transcriptional regulator [Hymenobacter psychrophilus]SDX45258.1 DNA-binding transcriptional regulator, XRE-family HTH domain [Hymenobacter psychrophilus]